MNFKKQAGLTLIEVLVSLVILSFGLLGLVGLQSRASTLGGDAEDRTRASLLAQQLAAAMVVYNSTDVSTGSLGTFYSGPWQAALISGSSGVNANIVGLPANATATVTPSAVGPGSGVVITIKWTVPSTGVGRTYLTTVSLG